MAPNVRPANPIGSEKLDAQLGVNQESGEAEIKGGFTIEEGEVYIASKYGYEWILSEIDFRKASPEFAEMLDVNKPILRTKAQRDAGDTIKWRFALIPNNDTPDEIGLRSFQWLVSYSRPFPFLHLS